MLFHWSLSQTYHHTWAHLSFKQWNYKSVNLSFTHKPQNVVTERVIEDERSLFRHQWNVCSVMTCVPCVSGVETHSLFFIHLLGQHGRCEMFSPGIKTPGEQVWYLFIFVKIMLCAPLVIKGVWKLEMGALHHRVFSQSSFRSIFYSKQRRRKMWWQCAFNEVLPFVKRWKTITWIVFVG